MAEARALSALKDILFMYRCLMNYGGIFTDMSFEYGDFNAEFFIDYALESDPLYLEEDDLEVLHAGCGIKLICSLSQNWEQGSYPVNKTPTSITVQKLVSGNRLNHLPEIKKVLRILLESYVDAEKLFPEIFDYYVKGYFSSLLE